MERRILMMPSQTLAMKARRVLLREGLATTLVRPSPRYTTRGCTVGLELDARLMSRVFSVLEENKIPFGDILGS